MKAEYDKPKKGIHKHRKQKKRNGRKQWSTSRSRNVGILLILRYGRLRQAVEAQISAFQLVLQSHEARHVLVDTSEAREFTGEEGAQVEVVRELLVRIIFGS